MENMTPPAMPAQSSKTGLIALAIILLLLGSAIGYYFGYDHGYEKVVATPTASEHGLSGWNTYHSEEYGFEFKYPEALHFEAPPRSGASVLYVMNLVFLSQSERDINGISVYVDDKVGCTTSTSEKVISSDVWQYCTFSADGPNLSVFSQNLPRQEGYVVFQVLTVDPLADDLEQILSTFRYTNSN